MPTISQRSIDIPTSPIRKLVPLANQAQGTVVYHLNIGQPDSASPEVALQAAHHRRGLRSPFDRKNDR